MGKLFILFIVLCYNFKAFGHGSTGLLSQVPRTYQSHPGIKNKPSTCRNLMEPTRQHLWQLKRQGHKVALLMNTGSDLPMGRLQLRDSYMGQKFQRVEDLILFLENRVSQSGLTNDQQKENLIKKCLSGRKLSSKEKSFLPESCTQINQSRFFHTGFVFLNPENSQEPFVVHMYGDEKYNYTRASIRVESLQSYLQEDRLHVCESKILQIRKSAQNKIMNFFKNDHPKKLLASGPKSYNFVTHPWGLMSQNCNAWASEVLAASLFMEPHLWASVDRRQSKVRLWQTGFTPAKIPMTNLQAFARLPTLFIGGINMEEGNIIHQPYVVADILPAQTVANWLIGHGLIIDQKIISGSKSNLKK